MKLAAQYLRMSTEQQRYSLENQARLIAEYARQRGYEIIASYEDGARSGVTAKRRHGLQALLRDVLASPQYSAVLVVDVSRWGRFQNPDEAAHYEFLCREAGVRVHYCAEAFDDDDSPTSALMKSVKRVMAAEYSRQLSDRCRAGVQRVKVAGGKGGGPPPFGFARQAFAPDGTPGPILAQGERRPRSEQIVRLVHGPQEEIKTLRHIFRLYVDGMHSVCEIARILNAESVPYRRGLGWDESRVRHVLRNELAVGVYAFNRSTYHFGKASPTRPRAEWTRVKMLPPLISPALFAAAQTKSRALRGRSQTDAEMLGKLKQLLQQHGRLNRRLVDNSSRTHRTAAYAKRFGSISEAYKLIGYAQRGRGGTRLDRFSLLPEVIVERLKALLADKGFLNGYEIDQCPRLPTSEFVAKRFGSLEAAYKLAGYRVSRQQRVLDGHARRRKRIG